MPSFPPIHAGYEAWLENVGILQMRRGAKSGYVNDRPPQASETGLDPPNTERNSSSRTIRAQASSTRSLVVSSNGESGMLGSFPSSSAQETSNT